MSVLSDVLTFLYRLYDRGLFFTFGAIFSVFIIMVANQQSKKKRKNALGKEKAGTMTDSNEIAGDSVRFYVSKLNIQDLV